ncbi:hypothetical protein HDE76_000938 [Rhodanobacter sp. ANJX3]|nr:hypothetical protein [Rhodanobacter sp. ANJX3]NYE27763.1 hypothetical protein [Rhodanobacter sp. K2T2]
MDPAIPSRKLQQGRLDAADHAAVRKIAQFPAISFNDWC